MADIPGTGRGGGTRTTGVLQDPVSPVTTQEAQQSKFESAGFSSEQALIALVRPSKLIVVVDMTMEQRDRPATRPVMYLVDEDWSPRFEGQFFTVKMEAMELLSSAPASTANPKIGAKSTFPAYYYKIDVFCGYTTRSVFRRYSQFAWLYNQLPRDNSEAAPVMPPGTCFFQPQDDLFAQNRLDQLREFLRDLLRQPGNASHRAVAVFLELDSFGS